MLRLFDCLETEPNVLFRDSYREGGRSLSASEQALLRQYRGLSLQGPRDRALRGGRTVRLPG